MSGVILCVPVSQKNTSMPVALEVNNVCSWDGMASSKSRFPNYMRKVLVINMQLTTFALENTSVF